MISYFYTILFNNTIFFVWDRVVIFSFGEMDSTADLHIYQTHISDPSVPRAGPSTTRE